MALVVRTGSSTAKGNLIRSIMFPKNMDFEFYLDSIKFVIIMFIAATIGMIYCAYLYIIREVRIVRSKYIIISIKLHRMERNQTPRKNGGF